MKEKKLTQRQLQSIKTRNNIYHTAISLMKKKGFHNISVSEICQEAGVSVGAFYHYFPSKHSILDEVFKLADDYFLSEVSRTVQGNSTAEKIIHYFSLYAQYNVDRGLDFVKQLYNVQNNLFITPGRPMQQVLKEIVIEGQSKKELTLGMSPDEIVNYLFMAVRSVVYHWCLMEGSHCLVKAVEQYVTRLITSVQ